MRHQVGNGFEARLYRYPPRASVNVKTSKQGDVTESEVVVADVPRGRKRIQWLTGVLFPEDWRTQIFQFLSLAETIL
jgi:hypothetical protein